MMSTTTTSEANLSEFILTQGWSESAASPDRLRGFLGRHDAAEPLDLEAMSEEDFAELLA